MSDLRELYHEVIIDHSKSPRNYRRLESANQSAEGHNPLCGDHLTVYLDIKDHRIEDISFEGAGCAISKASASMMTQHLKGKTLQEAEVAFESFHQMVTGKGSEADVDRLGKLAVFSGVCDFPVRVKCASLAWHTLHAALEGKSEPATTE